MNIINSLPDDIKRYIFQFTDEYYRDYCRRKGFKRLTSESNNIFPKSIFRNDISYREILKQWRDLKNKYLLNKENDQYIKYNIRPSLQYCDNYLDNYLETLFPKNHSSLSIFGINTFQQLISYSIRLLNYGYNVILFIKPIHYQTFMDCFDKRLVEHKLDLEMKYEYITFNHILIPSKTKILISVLGSKRLKKIKTFINKSKLQGIRTYVLNYIQLNINQEAIGSGIYDIKR